MSIDVSVVVPIMNEEDNIAPLVAEIEAALNTTTPSRQFEILYVDDASTDKSPEILAKLRSEKEHFRAIRHAENCGQSTAVRTGVLAARGTLIATLDGDGQNDPADIPSLLAAFDNEQSSRRVGLVAGQRLKRQDTLVKRWASKIGNRVRSWALQDNTPDTGCGLKVFRRDVFLQLPYFDHMHRFLPALMYRQGYEVLHHPVHHRARQHGRSKYGVFDRGLESIADLLGVIWLNRRSRLPSKTTEL